MIHYVTIGIIGLAILGFFILSLIEKKHLNQVKNEIFLMLSEYGKLETNGGKTIYHIQDQHIEILHFVLKPMEELVINSRVMWEVFRSNKAMLVDQTEFLKSENSKWIIVYPSIHRIKRYINENEMVFVKKDDQIYDYQLILWIELKDYLEEIRHGT